jgi:hypothetical protein
MKECVPPLSQQPFVLLSFLSGYVTSVYLGCTLGQDVQGLAAGATYKTQHRAAASIRQTWSQSDDDGVHISNLNCNILIENVTSG